MKNIFQDINNPVFCNYIIVFLLILFIFIHVNIYSLPVKPIVEDAAQDRGLLFSNAETINKDDISFCAIGTLVSGYSINYGISDDFEISTQAFIPYFMLMDRQIGVYSSLLGKKVIDKSNWSIFSIAAGYSLFRSGPNTERDHFQDRIGKIDMLDFNMYFSIIPDTNRNVIFHVGLASKYFLNIKYRYYDLPLRNLFISTAEVDIKIYKQIKLIIESHMPYIIKKPIPAELPNSEWNWFTKNFNILLFSGGIRFFKNNFSIDLGLVSLLLLDRKTYFVPVLSTTFLF